MTPRDERRRAQAEQLAYGKTCEEYSGGSFHTVCYTSDAGKQILCPECWKLADKIEAALRVAEAEALEDAAKDAFQPGATASSLCDWEIRDWLLARAALRREGK